MCEMEEWAGMRRGGLGRGRGDIQSHKHPGNHSIVVRSQAIDQRAQLP